MESLCLKQSSKIWIRDEELVWRKATLLQDLSIGATSTSVFDEETKCIRNVCIPTEEHWPLLRNPEILIGLNDLTCLSYLHEADVLYNLQYRFLEQQTIYTYCGIVLVAINPYAEVQLYAEEVMKLYKGSKMREKDPHIFAVAEEAISDLLLSGRNQSIIVSGESGAGKTVSAKFAMRYLAFVCSDKLPSGVSGNTSAEDKVLASNPIMEAIGNAKTVRNDNSSRFGKFIQIGFDSRGRISGSNMRTYLLEKSRVTFQTQFERNYHIFYQLCSQQSIEKYASLKLKPAGEFYYTRQGVVVEIGGVCDAKCLSETLNAMNVLGFTAGEIEHLFRVISAILHLGNVCFVEEHSESCRISSESLAELVVITSLLDINFESFRQWLTSRPIATAKENIKKPLTHSQAIVSRDALAKLMYAKLFDWIVHRINDALHCSASNESFIGVLDIYGFETFEVNSFEQFCINYANEKLQNHFCQHVFKLEQAEYIREGIEWSHIDFADNQPCIDFIEEPLGVLGLLDDECKMPKGNDKSWLQKMLQNAKQTKRDESVFCVPKLLKDGFVISHFADSVCYQITGFVEKNRDTVNEELVNVLRKSKLPMIAQLYCEVDENSNVARSKSPQPQRKFNAVPPKYNTLHAGSGCGPQKSVKKSVGLQFRESLKQLMVILTATTPHYVRCIKPNDDKAAFQFDPLRTVQQLRACGVQETVRISSAGYPSRERYEDFCSRYMLLLPRRDVTDQRTVAELICRKALGDDDKFALGKSKIFFRTGQVALLEELRTNKLRASAVLLQRTIRGWLARRRFVRLRQSVIKIQSAVRSFLAKRKLENLRRTRAAVNIQAYWRMYCRRMWFNKLRHAVLLLQSYARMSRQRQRMLAIRYDVRARIIQRCFRIYRARRERRLYLEVVVRVQSYVRRWLAKRRLKQLKTEARSITHIKELNKGLENKIFSLQHKINDLTQDKRLLEAKTEDMQNRLAHLESLQAELSVSKTKENQSQALIIDLNKRLEALTNLSEGLKQEKIAAENRTARVSTSLAAITKENELLRTEIQNVETTTTNLKASLVAERAKAQTLTARLEKSKRFADSADRSSHFGQPENAPALSSVEKGEIEKITKVLLTQQKCVSKLSSIKDRQQEKIDALKFQLDSYKSRALSGTDVFVNLKVVELEKENDRLKTILHRLAEDNVPSTEHYKELEEKCHYWQAEVTALRAEIHDNYNRASSSSSPTATLSSNGSNSDIEPNVLYVAFQQQKDMIRDIANQLHSREVALAEVRMDLERMKQSDEDNREMLEMWTPKDIEHMAHVALYESLKD